MPEKDPTNLGWVTYLWVVLLSGLGGFVAFWQKLKMIGNRFWPVSATRARGIVAGRAKTVELEGCRVRSARSPGICSAMLALLFALRISLRSVRIVERRSTQLMLASWFWCSRRARGFHPPSLRFVVWWLSKLNPLCY